MSSRSFPAKYESKCPRCGKEIAVGMMASFPDRDSKDPVHESCPTGQRSLPSAKPVFIQVAAWVHAEDVPKLAEFIRTLRVSETWGRE